MVAVAGPDLLTLGVASRLLKVAKQMSSLSKDYVHSHSTHNNKLLVSMTTKTVS